MPTDPEPDPPTPPTPPPAPPAPSEDDVRKVIREELAAILGEREPKQTPAPRTDKEMEEYVEGLVQAAMGKLNVGPDPVPDPTPDPTPEPENLPENKEKWQEKLRKWMWDSVE